MITKIRGIVDSVSNHFVVIDVNGLGYQVHCSARALQRLSEVGTPVTLLTEMVIREDAHILLGFCTEEERECYRLLTSVQGVGMRVALSLLSLSEPQELCAAILKQDKNFIGKAEGVGPKLAARIVNELKDKVGRLEFSIPSGKLVPFPTLSKKDIPQDAVSALVNLGYKQNEAMNAIEMAVHECGRDGMIEDLIRIGLARLARS